MYGLPLAVSAIARLAAVARILGEGCVGVFIDHPSQVAMLNLVDESAWPGIIPVWINIDVGYHREGVATGSQQLSEIAGVIARSFKIGLQGVYTHEGRSYGSSSPEEALHYLATELEGLREGAISLLDSIGRRSRSRITLSLGASPTATALQNLLDPSSGSALKKYRDMLEKIKESFDVEMHAGVYPLMDMQQVRR